MTRAQVVQTMADHKSLDSPIYNACHQVLQSRDADDDRRYAKSEEISIWSKMSLRDIRRLGKRRKKSGKFLAEVIRQHQVIKQRK